MMAYKQIMCVIIQHIDKNLTWDLNLGEKIKVKYRLGNKDTHVVLINITFKFKFYDHLVVT